MIEPTIFAFDWLRTREGLRCRSGTATREFLESRLITAYLAGFEQARKLNRIDTGTKDESEPEGT